MTDKTREDFEAWAQSSPVNLTKNCGMYESRAAAFGFRAYQAATQQSAARIEALEAEVVALRKDAERYKWLRSVPNGFKAQRIVNDTPHGMDAAIDAAIEAERGEG